jgi:hypothetical protein
VSIELSSLTLSVEVESSSSRPEQVLPTANPSCEFAESPATALDKAVRLPPEVAQAVTVRFVEDSEFEAKMLAKASYYHRRRGSGDSNCSDDAYTDSAVTVPMLADTFIAGDGRQAPHTQDQAPHTDGRWTSDELRAQLDSSWPIFH